MSRRDYKSLNKDLKVKLKSAKLDRQVIDALYDLRALAYLRALRAQLHSVMDYAGNQVRGGFTGVNDKTVNVLSDAISQFALEKQIQVDELADRVEARLLTDLGLQTGDLDALVHQYSDPEPH